MKTIALGTAILFHLTFLVFSTIADWFNNNQTRNETKLHTEDYSNLDWIENIPIHGSPKTNDITDLENMCPNHYLECPPSSLENNKPLHWSSKGKRTLFYFKIRDKTGKNQTNK